MLEVSPREIDRLIEQTRSPLDLLEHRLKQLLLGYKHQAREELESFDSLSVPERLNYLPTFELITLKRNVDLAKDSIGRITLLNSKNCSIEAIDSILVDIFISYLTNRDLRQLVVLIEAELFNSKILSDPKIRAAVTIICQDELSVGGKIEAAKIIKLVNPVVLGSAEYRESLAVGFQVLLNDGNGDALLNLARECPSGSSVLRKLLADPEVQGFIAYHLDRFSSDFRSNKIVTKMFSSPKFQGQLLRKLSEDVASKNLGEFIDYCLLAKISDGSISRLRPEVVSRIGGVVSEARYLREESGSSYIRYLLLKDTLIRASIIFGLPQEVLEDVGQYDRLTVANQLPRAA